MGFWASNMEGFNCVSIVLWSSSVIAGRGRCVEPGRGQLWHALAKGIQGVYAQKSHGTVQKDGFVDRKMFSKFMSPYTPISNIFPWTT
jgi:hypothetical protein